MKELVSLQKKISGHNKSLQPLCFYTVHISIEVSQTVYMYHVCVTLTAIGSERLKMCSERIIVCWKLGVNVGRTSCWGAYFQGLC